MGAFRNCAECAFSAVVFSLSCGAMAGENAFNNAFMNACSGNPGRRLLLPWERPGLLGEVLGRGLLRLVARRYPCRDSCRCPSWRRSSCWTRLLVRVGEKGSDLSELSRCPPLHW